MYFSLIINRIIYLQLSDDEDTPYQCAHFQSTYLTIVIPTEIYQLQLQALLDHVSHLFSLGFESWNTSAIPPYQYTSSSVRRLDLEGRDRSGRRHRFNCKECAALIRSLLSKQCRTLAIEMEKSVCILALVHYMINLSNTACFL
ncbi:unnamed protein product [Rotaria sordida]|uniref:Uncharacterized protein n=1 Tax=Rotaria sordida TaxID=392033 RepID=A0A819C7H4_9BILA|nr:unnamed protein product [Rotaria sordida]CAF3814140.1 unnamed protein product [Rotaria sordida]